MASNANIAVVIDNAKRIESANGGDYRAKLQNNVVTGLVEDVREVAESL
jgi:hypothetical protein